MSLARAVRHRCAADRLGPQPLRQAHGRDPRVPDRAGRHGGDRQRRGRAGPDRRDLPRPVQLGHDAAGVPVLAGAAGLRAAGQRAGHPGRERLRVGLGRVPAGRQVAAGRHRQDRARDRRREDDPRRRRRRRRGPARRGLRHGRQGLHHRLHRASSPRWPSTTRSATAPSATCSGTIAAKNHRNGVDNPYAQLRKDLGEEFCRTVSDKNPMVADPLRRTDCSPVSDGAAAVVLSRSADRRGHRPGAARRLRPGQRFLPDRPPRPHRIRGDPGLLAARAGDGRRRAGGPGLRRGARLLHDRRTADVRGHGADRTGPGGAAPSRKAGSSRTASCPSTSPAGSRPRATPSAPPASPSTSSPAMQLTGTAGDMQLPAARRAAVQNMGGVGIANYVSVLEAV